MATEAEKNAATWKKNEQSARNIARKNGVDVTGALAVYFVTTKILPHFLVVFPDRLEHVKSEGTRVEIIAIKSISSVRQRSKGKSWFVSVDTPEGSTEFKTDAIGGPEIHKIISDLVNGEQPLPVNPQPEATLEGTKTTPIIPDAQRRGQLLAQLAIGNRMWQVEGEVLAMRPNQLVPGRPEFRSLTGATATVESSGIAQSRMTATRIVGGAMLGGKKGAVVGAHFKKDKSVVFLTIVLGDGRQLVEELPIKQEAAARKFAAAVNSAGRKSAVASPVVVEAVAAQPADALDQLKKLAELRDAGILTDDEFNAKKADILKRI